MKKRITKPALAFGCTAHYSGHTKTLYIKGNRASEFVHVIPSLVPPFPFDFIITNGQMSVKYTTTDLTEPIPNRIPFTEGEKYVMDSIDLPQDKPFIIDLTDEGPESGRDTFTEEQKQYAIELVGLIDEEIRHYVKGLNKAEIRELLDRYLINNPIDRTQKGCYNRAASVFDVKSEYVRDRYRKLREKGLIENDKIETTI